MLSRKQERWAGSTHARELESGDVLFDEPRLGSTLWRPYRPSITCQLSRRVNASSMNSNHPAQRFLRLHCVFRRKVNGVSDGT